MVTRNDYKQPLYIVVVTFHMFTKAYLWSDSVVFRYIGNLEYSDFLSVRRQFILRCPPPLSVEYFVQSRSELADIYFYNSSIDFLLI